MSQHDLVHQSHDDESNTFALKRMKSVKLKTEIQLNKLQFRDTKVYEMDFKEEEAIEISMDAYNLFIAANLTRAVNPTELNYCLQKCIYVFFI